MTRRHRADSRRATTLLAQECARLIAEEGAQDFRTAKRKAASRLGVPDKAVLPDNAEIEQALLDRRRLFHTDHQALCLRNLRETALEAMLFLACFRPKLVGSVLNGTAGTHAEIHLHLFTEPVENVPLFLLDHRIQFESSERRFKMVNGHVVRQPVFGFTAGDIPIELTVFTLLAEREAPCSSLDGRPMRRAGFAEVQALLVEGRL